MHLVESLRISLPQSGHGFLLLHLYCLSLSSVRLAEQVVQTSRTEYFVFLYRWSQSTHVSKT